MAQLPKINFREMLIFRKLVNIRRKLRFFRVLSALLIIVASMGILYHFSWLYATRSVILKVETRAPYAKEIKNIIEPLRYSDLPSLMGPDVNISLDFEKKIWVLRNIHRFDNEGKVILEEDRYGFCGDLAAYVRDAIKPLFSNRYKIETVYTAESGYFFAPHATHVVLIIRSLPNGREYILDPSFRRYGHIEKFEDYLFFERMEVPVFEAERNSDEIFGINMGTPILIKKRLFVSVGG